MEPVLASCAPNPNDIFIKISRISNTTVAGYLGRFLLFILRVILAIEPECSCSCYYSFKILDFLFFWRFFSFETVYIFLKNFLLKIKLPFIVLHRQAKRMANFSTKIVAFLLRFIFSSNLENCSPEILTTWYHVSAIKTTARTIFFSEINCLHL